MRGLHLEKFTVAGQESGRVTLPCDGITSVDIEVHLKGTVTQGEANTVINVPVWVGEGHGSKTLIRGNLFFGPAPAGTTQTTYGVYVVKCSTSCILTPGGNQPPSTPPAWPIWSGAVLLKKVLDAGWWVKQDLDMLLGSPGPVTYVPDDSRMKLGAGYYDRTYIPGVRWWYKADQVDVECSSSVTTVTTTGA